MHANDSEKEEGEKKKVEIMGSKIVSSYDKLLRNRRTLLSTSGVKKHVEKLRFVVHGGQGFWNVRRGLGKEYGDYFQGISEYFFLSPDTIGQAKTDDVEVFNIPRKQAASTSGTKFELAETYSYEEFASRVVPRRALRHLAASRSPRAFPVLSHRRPWGQAAH